MRCSVAGSVICAPPYDVSGREAPLPFGIDYIDPWVNVWPGTEIPLSKAWASYHLGARLEPWARSRERWLARRYYSPG